MPAYSTLRTFISAVQTGRTNIVNVLEQLCQETTTADQVFLDIQAPGSADPLPASVVAAFARLNMKPEEIAHVSNWPAAEKERVRAEIVAGIQDGQPLSFTWELHDGDRPDAEFRTRQGGGRMIAFRSPRSAVRLSRLNYGDVRVEEL